MPTKNNSPNLDQYKWLWNERAGAFISYRSMWIRKSLRKVRSSPCFRKIQHLSLNILQKSAEY